MLTGEIRSQVDRVWDAFWSGGISNPLEVIEQITYLLFLRRLDDLHTLEESKANRLKKPMARRVFPEGKDPRGRSYEELRWSRLKNMEAKEMYTVVAEHVFPFLRTLGGDGSTYAGHMKDARFTIPTPALLARVVDMLDHVPMDERDTKGDLYEYMLGKIASAGQNGQFRTPRHIIQLMVELMAPGPQDVICDPACGTAGFLVAASEYVRKHHPDVLRDPKLSEHFHHGMFHGYDFDATMLRIGSMNMLLHGVENPGIRYRDSLAQDHASDEEKFTIVLANPPFAGSLDFEGVAKDLLAVVKTKKTELLFLALFLRLLRPGGRAAVIVPDGVLFGSSTAHKMIRRMLVEEQKLEAIISLPSGVFKPYAGVSTAIIVFTKTNSGGTDEVWFYDVKADGWSLDDKRSPLLGGDKLGPVTAVPLSPSEHERNNLPNLLERWRAPRAGSMVNTREGQCFTVPKQEIERSDYDLTLQRYQQVKVQPRTLAAPSVLSDRACGLVAEIQAASAELHAILNRGQRSHERGAWQQVRLGDICELKYGKSLPEANRRPGSVDVYGSNGIVGKHDAAITDGPTVVIGRKGSFGEVAFSEHGCWPIDTTYFIDQSSTTQSVKWLAYRLRALGLKSLNRSAAIPGLNREDAYRQVLLLPPIEDQITIVGLLDRISSVQALHRDALANLSELMDAVEQRLFVGELPL